MLNNDPRALARHYYRNLPQSVLVVDEPWWWPICALDSGIINVGFETDYRGPLAIVARRVASWKDYQSDITAICGILKALDRPEFDAWPRNPKSAHGLFVGIVNVVDMIRDEDGSGLWYDGPMALKVDEPLLLVERDRSRFMPAMARGSTNGLEALPEARRESLRWSLLTTAQFA